MLSTLYLQHEQIMSDVGQIFSLYHSGGWLKNARLPGHTVIQNYNNFVFIPYTCIMQTSHM